MLFTFKSKKVITKTVRLAILKDIAQGNIEHKLQWSKVNRKLRNRAIKWTITRIPFFETLPEQSQYFMENDFYENVHVGSKIVKVDVDEIAIAQIKMAESLGASKLSQIKNAFYNAFGFEQPKAVSSIKNLRNELETALKYNGVELVGS